jgi:hypothetical protein
MPTWAARVPNLSARLGLPREPDDAPVRGDGTADQVWTKRIDQLLAIRRLEDDWDGQGSPAPAVEVVDSALVLALLLRTEGVHPPTGVVQTVCGEVLFDWQWPNGKYVDLEVNGVYSADLYVAEPGQAPQLVELRVGPEGAVA